jgi:hypothetical protein
MKKFISSVGLITYLVVFLPVISFGQEVDLTGTWIGSTEVPDQGTDEMTLVIQKEEGEYAATISDTLGMLQDTECEDFEFKDGTLSFTLTIFDGYESMTVWISLDVDGDNMSGYWEVADGTQGAIAFERK